MLAKENWKNMHNPSPHFVAGYLSGVVNIMAG